MGAFQAFKPIYSLLPEVKAPEEKQPIKKRLLWTAIALLLFFIMGNIEVIGISAQRSGQLEQLQVVLASKIGSIITVGIGPIVLASIILQLLIGGGIVKLDLSDPKDKAEFTGMQKLLAIIVSFFEASVYVLTGFLAPAEGMFLLVVLQIAIGSIILLYLDEVVSRYGVGSGIGLFIAGGVAGDIIWGIFSPLDPSTSGISFADGSGLLFVFLREITSNVVNAFVALLPVLFTLAIFFVVVYAEGIHVNIPITMGRRGTGGRYPVKFLYVSNMPVILAVALFANIRIWATLIAGKVPVLDTIMNGLATIVIPPYGLVQELALNGFSPEIPMQMLNSITGLQFIGLGGNIIHAILYIIVLTVVCVIFGKFWIELGGQGPERVAAQLDRAGMYIPGFRRDPRVIRQVLDRYIPTITILGSAFVGVLAGIADLTGAIGSGTGILLTVGIVYRLYEELAKQQVMEMHPMLGKLFGQA
ncbi:MAG: preprotein translocase subunit SecY [Candidatus Diapherotrites archaeon]|uniref:Protein translocase subunit SecY n=1 Tax=Candidatus Iainarchaeum sp. TaxID=3101447 RepID=A0A8T3YLF8_9ARCH|nr:preprotein translocase subunit SecY [Candidatus Diapherotrites archaeon]